MNSLIILTNLENITPTRNLNLLYIIIDIIFLIVFLGLLIWKKRYQTVIFALFGGLLYTLVDYGGFYLASHSRQVFIDGVLATPLQTFWVLLWMSMSYGITNFAFIWTCISKDKYMKYWLFLIISWWLCAPSIAQMGAEATITTTRTTTAYHGWMAVVLVVSYLLLIFVLLKKEKPFVNILYLCLVGIAVQFSWEFALLINGIRPFNEASVMTLLVDSFIETNLGMPLAFLIFYIWRKYQSEDLSCIKNELNIEISNPNDLDIINVK